MSENTSKEVYSLSHFKLHASDLFREIRASGQPLWLTVNGKGKIVIQDAASYQKLLDQVDVLQSLIGIRRGLADVAAGRATSMRSFEKEFRKRRDLRRRAR